MSVSKDELKAAALAVKEGTPAREIIFAGAEWARRRADGISVLDVLVRRKVLSAQRRRAIERELGKDDPAVLEVLTQAEAEEPQDSLSHGATEPSVASVADDSLGNDENVGDESKGRYEPRLDDRGQQVLLGKGGIGRVVLVFDRFVGRDVALKELAQPGPDFEHDTRTTAANEARFLREARVTGQLEHPSIVPVFELGRRQGGSLYYTMRRVVGRTLHQALREARTLERRLDLLPHFISLCQALAYAHSRAVIHRDVKPQNVMIGQFGETYVLDWGLARVKGKPDPRREELKLAPDITGDSLGGAIGTPAYMSPEQARGQVDVIDEKSDVFGLGAVLYELVTGRPPYVGPSAIEVVERVRKGPPDEARTLEPAAPTELVDIVNRAMSRAPEDRYASVDELVRDVEAWRSGRRVSAHNYSSWELLKGFARHNRLALAITAPAMVALLAVATVAWWQLNREHDEARRFAQFYLDEVSPTLAELPGADDLVKTLTERTLAHYQRTVDPRSGSYDDRLHMAQAFVRLGRLAYNVGRQNDARTTFGKARELLSQLVNQTDTDFAPARALAEAHAGLGDVDCDQGHDAACELAYATAVEYARRAERLAPRDKDVLETVSQALRRLGNTLVEHGRYTAARPLLESAVASDETWLRLFPDSAQARSSLSLTLNYLATLEADLGQFDRADVHFKRGLALAEAALQKTPHDARASDILMQGLFDLGDLQLRRGLGGEAKQTHERCVAEAERLLAGNPEAIDTQILLAWCQLSLDDTAGAQRTADRARAKAVPSYWELLWMHLDLARGDNAAVVAAAPKAARTSQPQASIQGAMAAALLGEVDAARKFAAEAEQLLPASRWVWLPASGRALGRLEGKNAVAVHALVTALDDAYSRASVDGAVAALRAFSAALGSGHER